MIKHFAHITQADNTNTNCEQRTQSLEDHSNNVGEIAKLFANDFGFGNIAFVMGLLHDKGKEQLEWQKYIQGATGYNKKYSNVRHGPHHAYVGACIAQKQYPQLAPLMAQPMENQREAMLPLAKKLNLLTPQHSTIS